MTTQDIDEINKEFGSIELFRINQVFNFFLDKYEDTEELTFNPDGYIDTEEIKEQVDEDFIKWNAHIYNAFHATAKVLTLGYGAKPFYDEYTWEMGHNYNRFDVGIVRKDS